MHHSALLIGVLMLLTTAKVDGQWSEMCYDDSLFFTSLTHEREATIKVVCRIGVSAEPVNCQSYWVRGEVIIETDSCMPAGGLVYYRRRVNGYLDSLVTRDATGVFWERWHLGAANSREDLRSALRQAMPSHITDVPFLSEWRVYNIEDPTSTWLFRLRDEQMIDSLRIHRISDSVFVEYADMNYNMGDTLTYRHRRGRLIEVMGTSGYRSMYEYNAYGELVRKQIWRVDGSLRTMDFTYNEEHRIVEVMETEQGSDGISVSRTCMLKQAVPPRRGSVGSGP